MQGQKQQARKATESNSESAEQVKQRKVETTNEIPSYHHSASVTHSLHAKSSSKAHDNKYKSESHVQKFEVQTEIVLTPTGSDDAFFVSSFIVIYR
jgi:hypothetical protein